MIVKGFKDVTGQEYLAQVIESNLDHYIIKNPICLIPTEQGVMPMPYVMLTQEKLKISSNKLLFDPFDPIENLVNVYKQKFGGILEPEKRIIV